MLLRWAEVTYGNAAVKGIGPNGCFGRGEGSAAWSAEDQAKTRAVDCLIERKCKTHEDNKHLRALLKRVYWEGQGVEPGPELDRVQWFVKLLVPVARDLNQRLNLVNMVSAAAGMAASYA